MKARLIVSIAIMSGMIVAGPAWAARHNRQQQVPKVVSNASLTITGGISVSHGGWVITTSQGYNRYNDHRYRKHYRHGYKKRHHRQRTRGRGYWKLTKVWVDPVYKMVWRPGRYNRYGGFEPGHKVRVAVRPGCWVKKRVWVSHRDSRHGRHY